jgi:hypothetical protein
MGKKDIIILVVVFVTIVLNLYLRYAKKKKGAISTQGINTEKKGGFEGQPDDYEPYAKKK